MAALEKKRQALTNVESNHQELRLGKFHKRVEKRLKDWQASQVGKRIWKEITKSGQRCSSGITDRLGWLELPDSMEKEVATLRAFADKVKADGIKDVVLLGMGGSSLAPEVFEETFGNAAGLPQVARARQHSSGSGARSRRAASTWRARFF